MEQVYTVSFVNNYIKSLFVRDYVLNRIYLKGEVSNCKYHSSGHIYFTLKDETGQMACVMFAGNRSGLNFLLKEGQSVIVFGSISVYERDGKYQMYAKEIRQDGLGLLYERYEELKRKLEAEGLFDAAHKKTIPPYVKRIGIVTAKTGAAIQDIIHVSHRRNPYVQLILYPAKVQGEGAAKTVAAGIAALDKMGVDVIIAGRGGGSIEDLWAFNEEIVARAIYDCKTPVISAVGHETDTTIADFAADLRAPTPSAGAELAVNEYAAFEAALVDYHSALYHAVTDKIEENRSRLAEQKLKLSYLSPAFAIHQKQQYSCELSDKLTQAIHTKIKDKRHEFFLLCERLKGVSPLNKLKSGYSYVSDEADNAVTSVSDIKKGDALKIAVTDGLIHVTAKSVEKIERK